MRIISGKYKGQALHSFSADHIRPTTDRVKESLFNILQNEVESARVLDLFAGTGNLGLEALSRGAGNVVFVEKHPQSLKIIKKNIEKLKVPSGYEIVSNDVLIFLKSIRMEPVDLIFADPPFTEAIADDVMKAISTTSLFKATTIMAIESAKREKLDDHYGDLIRSDYRTFGDKVLSFFTKK